MHLAERGGPLAVSFGIQDAAPTPSTPLALLAVKDETWLSGSIEAGLFWRSQSLIALPGWRPSLRHPLVGSP